MLCGQHLERPFTARAARRRGAVDPRRWPQAAVSESSDVETVDGCPSSRA